MEFHHIGIFTKTLKQGQLAMSDLVPGINWRAPIMDKQLLVQVQFGTTKEGICYELVAPYGDGNPVDLALKKRSNILNHLAYSTENFDQDDERLINNCGATAITDSQPAVAFNNKRVRFYLNRLGFIIELIEG